MRLLRPVEERLTKFAHLGVKGGIRLHFGLRLGLNVDSKANESSRSVVSRVSRWRGWLFTFCFSFVVEFELVSIDLEYIFLERLLGFCD